MAVISQPAVLRIELGVNLADHCLGAYLVSTLVMGFALALPLFLIGLFGYGLTAFVSSPLSSYVTAARGKWLREPCSLTTATFGMGMVLAPSQAVDWRSLWNADEFSGCSVVFVSRICYIFIEHQPIDHHDLMLRRRLLSNQRFIALMGVLALQYFRCIYPSRLRQTFSKVCADFHYGADHLYSRRWKFIVSDCIQPCQLAAVLFAQAW